MKYTFTLTPPPEDAATDTDGEYATATREKIVLESRAGESDRHIALKILAYALYKSEAAPLPLRIEQGVGQRHKPDLVATLPDADGGAVVLWIDCGQIETKRLGRIAAANPRARIVVVKPTENEARLYARAAARFLPDDPARRARVRFAGFGDGFLDAFRERLRGANDLGVSRPTPGRVAAAINGADLSAALTEFAADALPG